MYKVEDIDLKFLCHDYGCICDICMKEPCENDFCRPCFRLRAGLHDPSIFSTKITRQMGNHFKNVVNKRRTELNCEYLKYLDTFWNTFSTEDSNYILDDFISCHLYKWWISSKNSKILEKKIRDNRLLGIYKDNDRPSLQLAREIIKYFDEKFRELPEIPSTNNEQIGTNSENNPDISPILNTVS